MTRGYTCPSQHGETFALDTGKADTSPRLGTRNPKGKMSVERGRE